MKKVLSVLLAGAMMFGMSVASFADVTFGAGDASKDYDTWTAADVKFTQVLHEGTFYNNTVDVKNLEAGDVLYFPVTIGGNYVLEAADKDWYIKIDNAEYVKSAEFFWDKDKTLKTVDAMLYVKVTLEDDFDAYEEDEVKFHFYIYDRQNDVRSEKVKVAYDFIDYTYNTLTKADLAWVITVDGVDGYKYAKGDKAAKATIDFDGQAYTEFKMYAEEKYVLSATTKYNKALSKEHDTDVEVITFRMNNVENFDILFPAAKDNKQIVAVVDGELVPVEATYVEDHKFQSGKKADGYLVEDAEYLTYAVIDADVEIEVEAEVEAPVEADKANPETGAADFVGAAVAMAVVSVAAAGALALKK